MQSAQDKKLSPMGPHGKQPHVLNSDKSHSLESYQYGKTQTIKNDAINVAEILKSVKKSMAVNSIEGRRQINKGQDRSSTYHHHAEHTKYCWSF